jgi:hypothetical protein
MQPDYMDAARAVIAAHIEAQAERVRELEGALEPFARTSDRIHSGYDDGIAMGDTPMWCVLVSDLRRARETLTRMEKNDGQ